MHQMTINGKRAGIEQHDLLAVAERQGICHAQAVQIIEQVADAVGQWQHFAQQAGVSDAHTEKVANGLAVAVRH